MFKIQIKGFFIVAMISMMVVIGCSSISKNSNTPIATEASPSVSQVKDNMAGMNHGTKFNINTSLEPELDEIAASLKIDALYDKVKKQRPYNNLNELVSKQVLTQAQFDQVKDMLTLEGTLTGEAKDADYMVKLGLMKGHLLVAKELLDMKRPAEALPHIGHPIEELYVTVADQLPARGVADFKATLDEAKDFIKDKPNDPQVMPKFNAAVAAVDRALAAIPATQRSSPTFIPQVINGLLDSASAEYGGAISANKIEEVDYQDSRGFVAYASILAKDIATPLQKTNAKAQGELKASLDDLKKTWPTVLPPSKPVFTGDEVAAKVKKIEEITKPLTGKATAITSNADTSTDFQPGLAKFKGVVTKVLTSVEGNDLQQAKKEMGEAIDAWGAVENKLKVNKDAYKTLEEKLSDVQTNLVIPPNPDRAKSIASLQALIKTVDTYANKGK